MPGVQLMPILYRDVLPFSSREGRHESALTSAAVSPAPIGFVREAAQLRVPVDVRAVLAVRQICGRRWQRAPDASRSCGWLATCGSAARQRWRHAPPASLDLRGRDELMIRDGLQLTHPAGSPCCQSSLKAQCTSCCPASARHAGRAARDLTDRIHAGGLEAQRSPACWLAQAWCSC
jgi:hypothetical protein